jgi:LacI family transcriptional regulator
VKPVGGCDNQLLIAGQVRPALTTIAQPHYETGWQAVQLALSQPDGAGPRQAARPVTLPCRLMKRQSA